MKNKEGIFVPGFLAFIVYNCVPYWDSDVGLNDPKGYLDHDEIVILIFLSEASGARYWYVLSSQGPCFVYESNLSLVRAN